MKTKTKYMLIALIIFLAAAIGLFIYYSIMNVSTKNQFAIMSTTDIHGKVWDKNLEADQAEPNNLLSACSAVNDIREQYDQRNILFDNGDLFQGTILSTVDIPHKYTDYDSCTNPSSLALSYMNYDGYTLGNHEFNFNTKDMAKCHEFIQRKSTLVCCNLYYPGNNQRVYKPYMTKTINVDNQDLKIGIIGVTNTDVPRWENSANYNGWLFHSAENPNGDISYEISKAQDEMEKNGDHCDFTIVAYHGGFFVEGSANPSDYENYAEKLEAKMKDPIQLYKNSESQGYRAVRNSHNIDMFILGHDHSDIYSNQQFKNADGKDTLVVNGAKKDLTKSVFEVTKDENTGNRKISLKESQNLHFSDYGSDPNMKSKIQPYAESLTRLYNSKACDIRGNWNFANTPNEFYVQQTDIADMVNRAQLWYVKKTRQQHFKNNHESNINIKQWFGDDTDLQYDENEPIDADLSLTTINLTARPDENNVLTYKEVACLYPFDNTIDYIPVKGQTIKDLLEYNASNRYVVKTDNQGRKHVEIEGDKYTCPITYGLNFVYDMTRPAGDRVLIDGFSNGKKFDPNKTYCVALNNYLRGNYANPILAKLGYTDQSMDTAVQDSADLSRDILIDYTTTKLVNNEPLYPTSEADKNGENISHWSIKY